MSVTNLHQLQQLEVAKRSAGRLSVSEELMHEMELAEREPKNLEFAESRQKSELESKFAVREERAELAAALEVWYDTMCEPLPARTGGTDDDSSKVRAPLLDTASGVAALAPAPSSTLLATSQLLRL